MLEPFLPGSVVSFQSEADQENLGGNLDAIQYWPATGFPAYYFPAEDQEDYVRPLVAVQFQQPASGVVIGIQCRLWADNVDATLDFQLLVD